MVGSAAEMDGARHLLGGLWVAVVGGWRYMNLE